MLNYNFIKFIYYIDKLLENLLIKNIVLIDEANIDFNNNLCVLTGETGSGKSILLDALSLAIGVRSSSRLLRNGEKQGSVVATFNIKNNFSCQELLKEMDIDFDDEIVLRRVITEDGKSKAYINDIAVGQTFLNRVGEELVEIHGQHDQRGLLNPSFHRDILDEYGNLKDQRNKVNFLYEKWKEIENKYLDILNRKDSIEREIDYLEHVCEEIRNMNIQVGEEDELNDKRNILMNKEKVLSVLENVKNVVEGQNQVVKSIATAQSYLSKNNSLGDNLIEENKNAFEDIVDDFERSILEFNEGMNKIELIYENLDLNETTVDEVEERLFAIRSMARKFNISSDLLPDFLIETEKKLNDLKTQTVEIGDLETQSKQYREEFLKESLKLRDQRKFVAGKLKEEIIEELIPLKMGNTRFETEFKELDENNWNKNGIDSIRFLVAINAGTNLDDLSKVASGGELSRFMLAFKVVLSKVKSVPTMIFDEIDTGVSGVVADAIGERLKKLGQNLQVFVITHLPQVASKGDNHFKISKESRDNKTYTIIQKLNKEERINEIAKMISGETITQEALTMAKKLLNY